MNIIFALTSLFFFLWIVRNVLFWIALWQLKEYRFDRVKIHLLETMQGQTLLFSPWNMVRWVVILLYPLVVIYERYIWSYQWLIFFIFFLLALQVLREVFFHLVKRPIITIKALMVIAFVFFIIALLYVLPIANQFVWLMILDKLVVLIVAFAIFAFSIPTEFYRDLQIEKAVRKIENYKRINKKLLVIGITGSYGKSSTKEYVAQMLDKKFNVLKTQGTNNTPIGIANTILGSLRKDTQIFVVEMGAYKKGEIAQLCEMVRPTIGILTAVNMQHASLFGDLENTKQAKYELMESLPKNGLALFNGNNQNAVELYKKSKKKKILYKVQNASLSKITDEKEVVAYGIVTEKNAVSFSVVLGKKSLRLTAPLVGTHNVENILPGVFLAHHLGMNDAEIKKAISVLVPIPKTMILHQALGVSIVDDTFNANPQAVRAVLEYMKLYTGKRILVMQPMIELGKNASDEHELIGKEIGNVCDFLFLTNKNFYQDIFRGMKKSKKKCVVVVGNTLFISQRISALSQKGDIITCEGKEAAFVLDRLF